MSHERKNTREKRANARKHHVQYIKLRVQASSNLFFSSLSILSLSVMHLDMQVDYPTVRTLPLSPPQIELE